MKETSNSHSFKHSIHMIMFCIKIGTKIQMNQLKRAINCLPNITGLLVSRVQPTFLYLKQKHVLLLYLLPISDTISKINIVFLLSSQEHPSQDFPSPPKKKKKSLWLLLLLLIYLIIIWENNVYQTHQALSLTKMIFLIQKIQDLCISKTKEKNKCKCNKLSEQPLFNFYC